MNNEEGQPKEHQEPDTVQVLLEQLKDASLGDYRKYIIARLVNEFGMSPADISEYITVHRDEQK